MAGERMVNVPNSDDIQRGFDTLAKSEVKGVRGVMEFQGTQPGPTLYVGLMSHGNEQVPAGLIRTLSDGRNGGIEIVRGKVRVVMNNLEAAIAGVRVLPNGINFNRLPKDILRGQNWDTKISEVARMRALHNAGHLDASAGFDAHTTIGPSEPLKIHIKGDPATFNTVGIRDYTTGIVPLQGGTVAQGNFIGTADGDPRMDDDGIPVLEMEAGGPHHRSDIIESLVHGLVATLREQGMIDDGIVEIEEGTQHQYDVVTYQPNLDQGGSKYRYANKGPYEAVSGGEIVATDESENKYPHIIAPHDGNLILPPAAGQIVDPHDSDWWYSTPVQKTTQQFVRARLNRTA